MPDEKSEEAIKRARVLHDGLLATYFSMLVVFLNSQVARDAWPLRLASEIVGRPMHSFLDSGVRLATLAIWLCIAGIAFLFLRLAGRFSFVASSHLTIGGGVALAGFPLAYVWMRARVAGPIDVLLPISGILCAFIISKRRFPNWLSPVLLALFVGLSAIEAVASERSGFQLLWPGYDWVPGLRPHPNLVYPLVALLCSLAWLNETRLVPDKATSVHH